MPQRSRGYSNSASGLTFRRPLSLIRSGSYTSAAGSLTATTVTLNRMYYHPFILDRRITFDRIAMNHAATTGSAGAVMRLGIYANHATDDKPDALILDAGTVALDTAAAFKPITISQALDPGLYWLAAANQVASGSPSITCLLSTIASIRTPNDAASTPTALGSALFEDSATGALPVTATPGVTIQSGPLVYLRAA